MLRKAIYRGGILIISLAIAVAFSLAKDSRWGRRVRADVSLNITYRLTITDPTSHIVHVEVSVEGWHGRKARFILGDTTPLSFTVGLFCSPKTMSFPWHYNNVQAVGEDGKPLPVQVIPADCDRCDATVYVDPQGQRFFTLKYDVIPLGGYTFASLPGEKYQRLASYLGEGFGFFFERHVLFLPANLPEATPVHFRFTLPQGWVALTPWARENGGFVTNLSALRSTSWYWGSGIAVGPFEVRERRIGPTTVRVGVSKSIPNNDRERAFRVTFGSFEFIQNVYGPFPTPYFMSVTVDEPSPTACNGNRHENQPLMDLLRGDATTFNGYQELVGGPGEPLNSPPGWQGISDEMSYLWMEMTAKARGAMNLDCWVMYQGNPTLYTYAAYKTGVWDEDWRGTGYHFVNPKVWYSMRRLDYMMNWDVDHWVFLDETALFLDYEIQKRTLGYFHFYDVVGRIYRDGTNPCSMPNLIATIRKVTGQDFTDWFQKYVFSQNAFENKKQVYYKDSDGDGVWDWIEKDLGLDPNNPDTDGDGLSDGQEMGLRWASDNPTFTDPLCPQSCTHGPHCDCASSSSNATPTKQSNGTPESPSSPIPLVSLEGSLIKADGNPGDWPDIPPFKTDPKEPDIADDITAFHVFDDSQYLYLRLDGRFSNSPAAQFTFDMWLRPFSGEARLVQVSTETSDPTTLHVIPLNNKSQPIFDKQIIYAGCDLSATTYEAVIPWKILGGRPKELVMRPYVVNEQGGVIEDLSRVSIAYFLTPTPHASASSSIGPTTTARAEETPALSTTATPIPRATASSPVPLVRYGAWALAFLVGLGLGWQGKKE